jgi:hypothetical protein
MLKQYERKAMGYGLIEVLALIIALLVTNMSSEAAGKFASIVDGGDGDRYAATISGTFSIAQQAVVLGYLPRLRIMYASER